MRVFGPNTDVMPGEWRELHSKELHSCCSVCNIVDEIKEEEEVVVNEMRKMFKLKNGVFWDFTPCGSCRNQRFGGT
jgi:heterodisulfide reductase subunit B